VLDGCAVETTCELLSLLWDVWGVRGKSCVQCKATPSEVNFPLCEYGISSRQLLFMRSLVVLGVNGRVVFCFVTYIMQVINQNWDILQVEPRICRNLSVYIPCSHLHLHFVFLLDWTSRQYSVLSWYFVTCKHQPLLFENTAHNLHNIQHSFLASICGIQ
jgi:hypothetical protein